MPGVLEASHHPGWAEVMRARLSEGPCGDSRSAAATPGGLGHHHRCPAATGTADVVRDDV